MRTQLALIAATCLLLVLAVEQPTGGSDSDDSGFSLGDLNGRWIEVASSADLKRFKKECACAVVTFNLDSSTQKLAMNAQCAEKGGESAANATLTPLDQLGAFKIDVERAVKAPELEAKLNETDSSSSKKSESAAASSGRDADQWGDADLVWLSCTRDKSICLFLLPKFEQSADGDKAKGNKRGAAFLLARETAALDDDTLQQFRDVITNHIPTISKLQRSKCLQKGSGEVKSSDTKKSRDDSPQSASASA